MRFVNYILIILQLLIGFKVFAQINYELEIAKLNAYANENLYKNNISAATDSIEKALNLLHNTPSLNIKGTVNTTAARIYSKQGNSQLALRYFLNASDNYEKLGDSLMLSNIYNQIGHVYFNLEAYVKAYDYFDKAITARPSEGNTEFILTNNEFKANCSFQLKEYIKAEEVYKNLLSAYTKNNDNEHVVKTLNNLTLSLELQKKYAEAIEYHTQLLGIFTSNQQTQRIPEVLNNIGYNYVLQKKYNEAKTAFLDAEKNLQNTTYSNDFKANLYTNIGICYQNIGEFGNAIHYLTKALQIRLNEKNNVEIARTNNVIALTYFRNEDLFNALEFSNDAIEFAQKTSNAELLSQCYKTHSTLLQADEEHQKALEYYSKHLLIQDSLLRAERTKREALDEKILELEKKEKELKLKIAEENVKDMLLEQLQLKAKQREQENEILKKQNELQESERKRVEQSLVLIKQQNEMLLRNKEIETLEKEKKIKEAQEKEQAKTIELLKTEKEKQELELQKQQLTLEKKAEHEKRLIWMSTLVFIILILAVLFLMHTKKKNRELSYQKKQIELKNSELHSKNEEIQSQSEYLQEANAELVAKNEEISAQRDELHAKNFKIEQQTNQIISSIQYAKRIQEAVLPEPENLQELLPSHFILFRPRDIVSGDFYWIKQINKFIYVAVADCTGHGVPGAFMSMLGTAFLNEITGQSEIMTPSEILDHLRDKVKKSLKQVGRSGEAKDGMDIALIRIDLDKKVLNYAGAFNPLVHIRTNKSTNEPEILTLKGDRMPIGIGVKEKEFTNHELPLYPNDMIYLYSDGYIDQFGGPNKTKFMSSNLKKIFLQIYNLPPFEQREILARNIDEWRGNHEQTDDMLMVGIKITDTYGMLELF